MYEYYNSNKQNISYHGASQQAYTSECVTLKFTSLETTIRICFPEQVPGYQVSPRAYWRSHSETRGHKTAEYRHL